VLEKHHSDFPLTGEKQMNRYAFFYFMKDVPQRIRETVPRHIDYWKMLSLPDYIGGTFADHSGGLSVRRSGVSEDPFVAGDVLAHSWLQPWVVS
jgi:hypothetical protein